jgi:hypothetical protein
VDDEELEEVDSLELLVKLHHELEKLLLVVPEEEPLLPLLEVEV